MLIGVFARSGRRFGALLPTLVGMVVIGVTAIGCSTGKGTGALAGAGVGALIGQAAGRSTEATLIGAAVGTGVGYIIGDQVDERKAREMSAKSETHNEVGPLSGTRWKLVSLNTTHKVEPYVSKIVEFGPNGKVLTTTTHLDGTVTTTDESYRVVGSTLIVNKPGYIVNARFNMEGQRLIVDDPQFSAVLERLPST